MSVLDVVYPWKRVKELEAENEKLRKEVDNLTANKCVVSHTCGTSANVLSIAVSKIEAQIREIRITADLLRYNEK